MPVISSCCKYGLLLPSGRPIVWPRHLSLRQYCPHQMCGKDIM
ncbi:hypothetical protein AtNW77_Chr3g0216691 [Arabidopsis thaliana]